MPVTKTAKRALRASKRKEFVNKKAKSLLEASLRIARRSKKEEDIIKAISLTDRAAKKKIIHKNKAARIKSMLSKLLPKKEAKKGSTKKSVKVA